MTYRSMTRTAHHLTEAVASLRVAASHIRQARDHDPDPEVSTPELYGPMLANVALLSAHAKARIVSGAPDLEREAKESAACVTRIT